MSMSFDDKELAELLCIMASNIKTEMMSPEQAVNAAYKVHQEAKRKVRAARVGGNGQDGHGGKK